MTALIAVGVLLSLAQAVAGWVLWRRVRKLDRYYTLGFDCLSAAEKRIAALGADIATARREHAELAGGLATLGAALDAHRAGSRHRRKP